VRYDAVNAMLLNEFLKQHRKVEEQQAKITQLKSTVARQDATIAQQQNEFQSKLADQQKQIKALTSGLQQVSNQLAAASPSGGGLEMTNSPEGESAVADQRRDSSSNR